MKSCGLIFSAAILSLLSAGCKAAVKKCLERARRFAAALDAPATPPPGPILYLMAGDAVPTKAVAAAERKTGRLEVIERAPGAGTVLRSSALLDERQGG